MKRNVPRDWFRTKHEYEKQPYGDVDLSADTESIIRSLDDSAQKRTGSEKNLQKLRKKVQTFKKKHCKVHQDIRDAIDPVEFDIFIEESALIETAEMLEKQLHQAAGALSQAAMNLNFINAKLNREPVDLEDEVYHHCVSQETLNKDYADENARYYAELEQRMQKMQNTATNDITK